MDCLYEPFYSTGVSPVAEERGNCFVEEFQVDDLLDLKGLPEPEKDGEEDGEATSGIASVSFENDVLHLSDISLPEETDAADLEWLSRFVHDCLSESPPAFAGTAETRTPCFQAKQPLPMVKAKRSKRRRRAGGFWFIFGASSVSSVTSSPSPSSSSSFSSYISREPYQKKRGRKLKSSMAGGERQCAHCGVQKTPQWRAGPLGPKTLCNACGVRFKSGRLFPEYRPACSPSFISDIHSNKHRKVLEMRRKKEG